MMELRKNQDEIKAFSLKTWLFVMMAVVFVVSFLLIFLNFQTYRSEKQKYIIDMMKKDNTQIEQYINSLSNDIESMMLSSFFSGENSDEFFSEAAKFEETGVKSDKYIKYIRQVLSLLYNYKTSDINSVIFYSPSGEFDYMIRGTGNLEEYTPQKFDWYKNCFDDLNGQLNYINTHTLYKNENQSHEETKVFGFARSVIDVNRIKITGVIQINCNEKRVSKRLDDHLFIDNQQIIILDNENRVVSASTDAENIDKLGLLEDESEAYEKNGKIILSSEFGDRSWRIINVIPIGSMNSHINATMRTTFLIMIILVLFVVFIAASIILRVVSPINKLTKSMRELSKGDFSVSINEKGLRETEFLSRIFNEMAKKLNKHIKKEYADKIIQKEMEIRMLQYQINPHFIYNTLDAIKMVSMIQGDNQASQMLTSLGKLMRYSLSNPEGISTVKKEIAVLEEYIALQTVRFNDYYEFIIDICPKVHDYAIPKLILQPLVENAIEHGFKDIDYNGEVIVTGGVEEDKIVFHVKNNGKLLSAERIQELNIALKKADRVEDSIGLFNTNKRIKLCFGDDYGVFFNTENGYTDVIVIIPMILNIEEEQIF